MFASANLIHSYFYQGQWKKKINFRNYSTNVLDYESLFFCLIIIKIWSSSRKFRKLNDPPVSTTRGLLPSNLRSWLKEKERMKKKRWRSTLLGWLPDAVFSPPQVAPFPALSLPLSGWEDQHQITFCAYVTSRCKLESNGAFQLLYLKDSHIYMANL